MPVGAGWLKLIAFAKLAPLTNFNAEPISIFKMIKKKTIIDQ